MIRYATKITDPCHRANLPQPVSELIGRDAEVAEVVSLIGAHRLVSLTGAGGIGKTRLALAVARQLLPQFADGVWVAELAPLTGPDLVPATIAAAAGIEFAAGAVSPELWPVRWAASDCCSCSTIASM